MRDQAGGRTHCDCGHPMEPLVEAGANWGDWKCGNRSCKQAYCQDCGSHLDAYNECMAYREPEPQS